MTHGIKRLLSDADSEEYELPGTPGLDKFVEASMIGKFASVRSYWLRWSVVIVMKGSSDQRVLYLSKI